MPVAGTVVRSSAPPATTRHGRQHRPAGQTLGCSRFESAPTVVGFHHAMCRWAPGPATANATLTSRCFVVRAADGCTGAIEEVGDLRYSVSGPVGDEGRQLTIDVVVGGGETSSALAR